MKTIRNAELRARLIDRLAKLTGEEKAGWGKMDVNQMMSHLVQAAELPFASSLPDKSNFISRIFVKPLVLYVLPIPKGVKTSPEFDQQENGRKPQEFFADRKIVVDAVDTLGTLQLITIVCTIRCSER